MKSDGKGNEINIGLTPHEIDLLESASLFFNAKIWDYDEQPPRSVGIGLSLYPEPFMLEDLKFNGIYVETLPNHAYLPEAKRAFFNLGEEMFDELMEKRYTCRRFWSGGKIKLYDLTREREAYQ